MRWFGLAVLIVAALLAMLLFLRRPRGKTPMDRAIAEVEAAMRRVGRPVTTGTTLGQLESRLGSHSPEVAAYLRALASGRYGLVWVPAVTEGRRALRRALASGLGFIGPLRACGRCRLGSSGGRASRVLEIETACAVSGRTLIDREVEGDCRGLKRPLRTLSFPPPSANPSRPR